MALTTTLLTNLKGAKGDSTPQTLPNDLTPNSVAIAPVSGDNTASALTQRNASGTPVFASDPSGNVTIAGTLNVAGAATLAAISGASLAVSGNGTVGGNLSVTGTLTAGALTASGTNIGGNQTVQGNDTVNGTLSVAGATTLAALTASSATITGNQSVQGTLTAASLVVNGTLTPNGDVNVGGNVTVQKKLTVNGGTQTVGLLTASGGLSSPSNGISVVGGTTTDTLSCSGNGTISGTVSLGTTTAAALTTTGNFRSNGNLSCTSGTTTLGGPVNVTGATTLAGLTASSSSITGNETVGGTLGVTGTASLAGVTASGTVTAANVTLSTGGKLTFADGTTQTTTGAVANDASYNSVTVAPVSGDTNAVAIKLNNSGGTTLFSVDASGNTQAAGTLKATGASTLGGLTAAATTLSTLTVSGQSNLGTVNATASTATVKNLTLTSGGGGQLTFADGTTQATSATAGTGVARAAFDMGGFSSPSNVSGTFWTCRKYNFSYNPSNGANSTSPSNYDNFFVKMPWPGQIVGWSAQQGVNAGSITGVYQKNGTNLTSFAIGSGTGNFAGTHAAGTYTFAANDTIIFLHSYSGTGATDFYGYIYVVWSA